MKTYTYSLLLAAAATGMAFGQTAYTTPVGYVALGDTTAGQPAVKATTDSAISIPLARPTEYSGLVASVAGSTVTVEGTPAFTVNQFTSVPYTLTVKSGTQKGLTAVVTANTANSITLTAVTGSVAGIAAGDQVIVAKAWTVGSFLPIAGIPNGTQLIAFDGSANGTNLPASQIYTKGPSNWIQTFGGSGDATNAILYPGESFILRTGPNPIAALSVSGEVPTTNHRTIINKKLASVAQDTRISYFSPTGEAVSASTIPASNGDQLIIFNNAASGTNKAASVILTKAPTGWIGTFGLSGNQDAYQIGSGVGYLYRRGSTAPVGDLDWSDQQGYIPSL